MHAVYPILALSLIVVTSACGRSDRSSGAEPPSDRAEAAPLENAPRSEGLCAEHGVLEAVCTKCNPRLIPIFQAKGDWCAEHGFPESFCPVCRPESGGLSQSDVAIESTDDGPADGLRVKLESKEVAQEAGIRTVQAIPGGDEAVILATATIVADNARSALVNVRAAGVIRAFKTEIGAVVRRGSPLAEIESAAVAEFRARLRAARARAHVTEATYAREKDLYKQGIASQRDAQAAEQAYQEARAEVCASLATLDMIGAEEGESGIYDLRAPIDGTVTRRNFTVGTLVEGEDPVFEIVDTSILWADIDIPESQVGRVEPGQRVVLEVDALSDREFPAAIQYVAPVIDPGTRTARARAKLMNPDGALRANVYARARVFTKSGSSAALVPRDAVQDAKGVQVVFVPVSANEYETRRVRVIPSDGELLAVTAGLVAGESVVTEGSFLLKTETLKESIGAGCCDAVELK
jgi:cobalt-zinc-cadmium efflux system membrane fusion protein